MTYTIDRPVAVEVARTATPTGERTVRVGMLRVLIGHAESEMGRYRVYQPASSGVMRDHGNDATPHA